jgi:hypothetical protein
MRGRRRNRAVLAASNPAAKADELRLTLRDRSYVFLPGLLAAGVVHKLAARMREVLCAHRWINQRWRPTGFLRERGDAEFFALHGELQRIEALHALAFDGRILEVVSKLTGEAEVLVHPRKNIRLCFPDETTMAHQDYPYVQGAVDTLTVWVPLVPTPKRRGGLALLEGSASGGIRPFSGGDGLERWVPARLDEQPGRWVSADYEVGDVVLFHSLAIHEGLPNRTSQLRMSVDFRYNGMSQPISFVETCLPYQPKLPARDELSANWTSSKWIEVPPVAVVTAACKPSAGMRVPPSALVGTDEGILSPLI